MNQEETNKELQQALGQTVQEYAVKLADETATKHYLALQLASAQQELEVLRGRVRELEGLLECETRPEGDD